MSAEEKLRSYAAQQDVPPVRLQADDVLVTARAQVRNRRLRTVALAGAVTALVLAGVAVAVPRRDAAPDPLRPTVSPSVAPTPAPLNCTFEVLPTPRGVPAGKPVVLGIDPSGRYLVGGFRSDVETVNLLLWTDGVPSQPSAGKGFSAIAVNTGGTVIGWTGSQFPDRRAAVFREGKVTVLPIPDGARDSKAIAINARGDVIGSAVIKDGSREEERPILWPAAGGFVRLYADVSDDVRPPAAIDDDGVIHGTVQYQEDLRPYRWDATGHGALLQLQGRSPSRSVTGGAGDWLLGFDGTRRLPPNPSDDPADPAPPASGSQGVRWDRRTGAEEKVGSLWALAISATGRVFGIDMDHGLRPVVWHDGTTTVLPLPDPAYQEVQVGGISADGRTIVASPRAGEKGPAVMVVWHC